MIIELLILATAVPIGLFLASLTREELVDGRRWFYVLVVVGVILGGWFLLTGFRAEAWTSFFIVIVAFVSLEKSKDKKFVKRRV